MYQIQEVLGGHPIIEFMLHNNKLCESSLEKSPGRTRITYLTNLFDEEDEDEGSEVITTFKRYNFMVADKMEINNDLCSKNIVATCLEYTYKESLFDRANFFLDIIFSQPASSHYKHMLMGLFDLIFEAYDNGEGTALANYSKFFMSKSETFSNVQPPRFSKLIDSSLWTYHSIPIKGAEFAMVVMNDH